MPFRVISFFFFFRNFWVIGLTFFLISVVGGLTPGRVSARNPPPAPQMTCYALGEESRTGTGPRQHEDRPPPRSRPATTPGSAASSPGRRSGGPATAPAPCTAGRPAQAGQLTATTTANGPGPPSAPPRSTAAPRSRRPATIPAPAARPPNGPPQPHRARAADAPT